MRQLLYRLWLWLGNRYRFELPEPAFTTRSLEILRKNLVFHSFAREADKLRAVSGTFDQSLGQCHAEPENNGR